MFFFIVRWFFLLLFYTRTRFPLGPDKSWIMVGSVCKDLFFWMNSLWKQYVFYRFRCSGWRFLSASRQNTGTVDGQFLTNPTSCQPLSRKLIPVSPSTMTSVWKTKFQSPFSTLKIRWHGTWGLKTDILLTYLDSSFVSLKVWHWLEDKMLKQPVQNNDFTLKPIDVDVNIEQDLTWHLQTCLLARPGKKSNRTKNQIVQEEHGRHIAETC